MNFVTAVIGLGRVRRGRMGAVGATSTLLRRETPGRRPPAPAQAAPPEGLLGRYRVPLLAYLASRLLVTSVAAVVALVREGGGQDPGAGPWPAVRGVHV